MKYKSKEIALLQVQHVQFCCVYYGWHTLLSTPADDRIHEIDFSVFFDNGEERENQYRILLDLLHSGETLVTQYHNTPDLKGGWIDYKVEF